MLINDFDTQPFIYRQFNSKSLNEEGIYETTAKIVKRVKANGLKFNAVDIDTIIETSIKLNIIEDNSISNKEATIKAKSRGIDRSTVHVN